MPIRFNQPFDAPNTTQYLAEVVSSGMLSGPGKYTKKCESLIEGLGYSNAYVTSSCSAALELSARLLDLNEGDEVILPSYTFPSTGNAFALRGCKLVFADSGRFSPHVSPESIEALITPKTKALIVVHYAGISCDMRSIMAIADANNIPVVEDAAQAIGSTYEGKPLGSFGRLGTISFEK